MSQTLAELLMELEAIEKSGDAAAAKVLMPKLCAKIDGIKEHTDKLYAEHRRLGEYRGDFQKSAAACKNEADRIYDNVKWCMEQSGFTDLPGKRWRIHIQNSQKDLKLSRGPDADIFKLYPTLVKREIIYSWNEDAVRLLLEAGEEFEYGQLVENRFAKFYVRKEV